MSDIALLGLTFCLVAAVYSSAGFGGGSSYLALLSVTSMTANEIRTTALACNLVVVFGSVVLQGRRGLIPWREASVLLGVSVIAAFLAASFPLQQTYYFLLLGVSLLFAATAMLLQVGVLYGYGKEGTPSSLREDHEERAASETSNPTPAKVREHCRSLTPQEAGIIGGSIGALSGAVGIGGGIFLSPVLYLRQLETPKRIAAISSAFILVNSLAGLLGIAVGDAIEIRHRELAVLMIAVALGGQLGSRFCMSRASSKHLRLITAFLVAAAGVRILWRVAV
ncbi:MAG: sulfite exporter TauE/SafE family protein [Planctomycetota bacterium]